MKRSWIVLAIVAAVLAADQALKIYIKTHFEYGEEFFIGGQQWAQLKFVENEGMAFGLELGGSWGKLALSLFRLVAVALLVFYLFQLVRGRASRGFIAAVSLILAGAIGNILDSVFYGRFFTSSPFHGGLARWVGEGEKGYADWLHGRVVDMFYFPIFEWTMPTWSPFFGGQECTFFSFIFNVADAAITVGVAIILIFQSRFFKDDEKTETQLVDNESVAPDSEPFEIEKGENETAEIEPFSTEKEVPQKAEFEPFPTQKTDETEAEKA